MVLPRATRAWRCSAPVDGKYAMIARQDNENLYLIYSDDLYRWEGGQAILSRNSPGSSSRSAIADRRSNWRRAG